MIRAPLLLQVNWIRLDASYSVIRAYLKTLLKTQNRSTTITSARLGRLDTYPNSFVSRRPGAASELSYSAMCVEK